MIYAFYKKQIKNKPDFAVLTHKPFVQQLNENY